MRGSGTACHRTTRHGQAHRAAVFISERGIGNRSGIGAPAAQGGRRLIRPPRTPLLSRPVIDELPALNRLLRRTHSLEHAAAGSRDAAAALALT